MYGLIVFLAACVLSVLGTGEITILHHPKSLNFRGSEHINESKLKDVYAASLGLSVQEENNWQGMIITNPFDLSNAIVTVAVDGISDIELPKGYSFPLRTDTTEENVFEGLKNHIDSHKFSDSKVVRVELSQGLEAAEEIFGKLKPNDETPYSGNLKGSIEQKFLDEVSLLNQLAKNIATPESLNEAKNVFWFKVDGLHGIVDVHGENSTQTREAKELLHKAILNLSEAFNSAYSGRVLINVIASDAIHTRRIRAAPKENEETNMPQNLAKNYNKAYPAIFNIILWFGVSMFFSLLAICIFISTMDPGRDSIIYRMTSTRMKKDN